jgi:hypothetical protein
MRMDRQQTDMRMRTNVTKLIAGFCTVAKAPKKAVIFLVTSVRISVLAKKNYGLIIQSTSSRILLYKFKNLIRQNSNSCDELGGSLPRLQKSSWLERIKSISPSFISLWFILADIITPDDIRDSSVNIGTSYEWKTRGSNSGNSDRLSFSKTSRQALPPIHPPIQWAPSVRSRRKGGRDVKLTTHLRLLLRTRPGAATLHAPHMRLWHEKE